MKKIRIKSFSLALCFIIFFCVCINPVIAEQNKKGTILKILTASNCAELYNKADNKMTTLKDIKKEGKKDKIAKNIRLRAAKMIEESNCKKAHYFFYVANIYEFQGDFEKAVKNYEKVLAFDSKCLSAYLNLGLLYAEKGMYKKALKVFKQYIETSKNNNEIGLIKKIIKEINIIDD